MTQKRPVRNWRRGKAPQKRFKLAVQRYTAELQRFESLLAAKLRLQRAAKPLCSPLQRLKASCNCFADPQLLPSCCCQLQNHYQKSTTKLIDQFSPFYLTRRYNVSLLMLLMLLLLLGNVYHK